MFPIAVIPSASENPLLLWYPYPHLRPCRPAIFILQINDLLLNGNMIQPFVEDEYLLHDPQAFTCTIGMISNTCTSRDPMKISTGHPGP